MEKPSTYSAVQLFSFLIAFFLFGVATGGHRNLSLQNGGLKASGIILAVMAVPIFYVMMALRRKTNFRKHLAISIGVFGVVLVILFLMLF